MLKRTLKCEKCHIRSDNVDIRQCDYPLCDKCETVRIEEIKEIEKRRKERAKLK